MNDKHLIEVLAKIGDPCAYINAATLDELYDAVTMPPPFGDDLLLHAEHCPSCAARIREARKHDLDTLPADTRRQLYQDVDRVKASIDEAFAREAPMLVPELVVRSFPSNISTSNESKLAPLKAARAHKPFPSLVRIDIGHQPAGHTQLGAAASHKASKPVLRRWFTLMWKQDDVDWSMEGKGRDVELASASLMQAGFITWKNPRTGERDRFELKRSDDGRLLVDIYPAKALIRAEAIRDTVDEAERRELLPLVHNIGTAL
jgi:hypothetical protein